MRTYDERVSELHLRMQARRHEKEVRRTRRVNTLSYGVCGMLALILSLLISATPAQKLGTANGSAAASIFADRAMLGYVVVALLAFCLGALATILCARLKAQSAAGEKPDD